MNFTGTDPDAVNTVKSEIDFEVVLNQEKYKNADFNTQGLDIYVTVKEAVKEDYWKSDLDNAVNSQLGLNSSGRSYVFDRSGWTW